MRVHIVSSSSSSRDHAFVSRSGVARVLHTICQWMVIGVVITWAMAVSAWALPVLELVPGKNRVGIVVENRRAEPLRSVTAVPVRPLLDGVVVTCPAAVEVPAGGQTRLPVEVSIATWEEEFTLSLMLQDGQGRRWEVSALVRVVATDGLFPNVPNPFNPATTIRYAVGSKSRVHVEVYNGIGQRVTMLVDDVKAPGRYAVVWDGRDLRGKEVASGLYFYRLRVGSFETVNRMLLLK